VILLLPGVFRILSGNKRGVRRASRIDANDEKFLLRLALASSVSAAFGFGALQQL
jgi:hypothetical protein